MMFGWSYQGHKWLVCFGASSTYDASQNVDFVEEHLLLVLVHVGLAEDLDGTLSVGVPGHAHPDLAESACRTNRR